MIVFIIAIAIFSILLLLGGVAMVSSDISKDQEQLKKSEEMFKKTGKACELCVYVKPEYTGNFTFIYCQKKLGRKNKYIGGFLLNGFYTPACEEFKSKESQ